MAEVVKKLKEIEMTNTIVYGDYVAMRDDIDAAVEDAVYEAQKHPEVIVYVKHEGDLWETQVTADAEKADDLIRLHDLHKIRDILSSAFTCYTCSITVRWVG